MSLRWSSYVAPKSVCLSVCLSVRGSQKRKTADFHVKSHFAWRKSATKFLCVKTVSGNVVRHSLALLAVQKWLVGSDPLYLKFWISEPRCSEIADFRYIFVCSASAVTPVWKLSGTKLWGIYWPNYPCKNDWWGAIVLPEFWVKVTVLEWNLNNKLR